MQRADNLVETRRTGGCGCGCHWARGRRPPALGIRTWDKEECRYYAGTQAGIPSQLLGRAGLVGKAYAYTCGVVSARPPACLLARLLPSTGAPRLCPALAPFLPLIPDGTGLWARRAAATPAMRRPHALGSAPVDGQQTTRLSYLPNGRVFHVQRARKERRRLAVI